MQDKADQYTNAINADHPTQSGDYSQYAKAQELVSNRHSKYALVDLVNHLLLEIERNKMEADDG